MEFIPEILICLNNNIFDKISSKIVNDEIRKFAEVYVVSPENFTELPSLNDEPEIYLNLQEAYNIYWARYEQEPRTKLYVSGEGDYEEATKAEFTYITVPLFLDTMRKTKLC